MTCSLAGSDEVRKRDCQGSHQTEMGKVCREKRLPRQILFQMNPTCSYFREQLLLLTKYKSTREESLLSPRSHYCSHGYVHQLKDGLNNQSLWSCRENPVLQLVCTRDLSWYSSVFHGVCVQLNWGFISSLSSCDVRKWIGGRLISTNCS